MNTNKTFFLGAGGTLKYILNFRNEKGILIKYVLCFFMQLIKFYYILLTKTVLIIKFKLIKNGICRLIAKMIIFVAKLIILLNFLKHTNCNKIG